MLRGHHLQSNKIGYSVLQIVDSLVSVGVRDNIVRTIVVQLFLHVAEDDVYLLLEYLLLRIKLGQRMFQIVDLHVMLGLLERIVIHQYLLDLLPLGV